MGRKIDPMSDEAKDPKKDVPGQRSFRKLSFAIRCELFAHSYIKHNCNGARALRAIGARGQSSNLSAEAYKLLRTDKVREVLANLRHESAMGSLEAIQRMTDYGRGDIGFFLSKEGRIDLAKARRLGKLHLAKKIRERTTEFTTKDGASTSTTTREVEMYDAQGAVKTMMQFQGLLDVTLPKIKDPRDLDAILHEELLRVHGKDRGLEISKALGLRVAPGVH